MLDEKSGELAGYREKLAAVIEIPPKLPPGGSRVVLEFGAVEPRTGMTHTILARTTGHYYANSTDSLKGNPALVTRLMKPGVFSQAYFMLHYLRRART